MRLETVQSISSEWNAWYDMMLGNRDVLAVYYRGVFDFSALDRTEQLQFIFVITRLFRTLYEQYLQWREGAMPDTMWMSWRTQITDALQYPGWQEVWRQRRHWFDDEFQSLVDSFIAGAGGRPLYEAPES